jgi:hypothetical protein
MDIDVRLVAGVPLIDVGQLDRLPDHRLHPLGQEATWSRSGSFAGVTCNASRCPIASTDICTFEPLFRL